jgi:hypothetical protein
MIRPYTVDDYGLIQGWREAHAGGEVTDAVLPPLGCVLEDECGPVAALFLFECCGCPVAFIDCPVTRPGLKTAEAVAAFEVLVPAIMTAAGKTWEPAGEFHYFRCATPAPIARVLAGMGFQRECPGELVPMYLER